MRQSVFACLLIACAAANVRADDAVDLQGKKHPGELVQKAGVWSFRGADGKMLPNKQIAYIRLSRAAPLLPKAPLTNTLHLPGQQRIAGMLRRVDAQQVEFITSWGKILHLERKRVVGIEQAPILLQDDFEQSLKPWHLEGKPTLDRARSLHGDASLLLDQPKQRATRTWKPALSDGDVRLYFYDDGQMRCKVDLFADAAKPPLATLVCDADGYASDQSFGILNRSIGWHQLHLEMRPSRLRIYVDDSCLGERQADTIQGIRIGNVVGKLWLDELLVTKRLPALPPPTPLNNADTLWLTHGEQLFGQVLQADRASVTLKSKLGQRAFPWTQLRGIFFAQPKPSTDATDPEITFRPAPGFPLDRLRAKLVRWERGSLIVQHELLGEIALERARLDKIHWLDK